jgi:cell wall-associated NlpC family hydrolase
MERGIDPREGFDCSGLVIGTLCELLDIPAKRWPGDMRHVRQLGWLGIAATVPRPGDIIISNPDDARLAHASISIADSRIIHASGKAGFVLAEDYPDCFANERIIPLEGLLQLVASRIG